MRPSEGIEGVVFEGVKECKQLHEQLDIYPTSISAGKDPTIARALERINMMKKAVRRLDFFVLDACTAEKIAEHIYFKYNDPKEQTKRERELSQGSMCQPTFDAVFRYLRQRKEQKFGTDMRRMATRSKQVTHERLPVRH